MKKLLYLFFSLMLITACNDDNTEITGQIEIPQDANTNVNFAAEGGVETISFTSNRDWFITCDAEWLSFSIHQGNAGDITIDVTATSTTQNRDAIVTIECGTTKIDFTVSQTKYPAVNTFTNYFTELTLEQYENEKFVWHLILKDQENSDSYGYKGKAIYFKLYLDKDHNYSKGIPFGEYTLAQTSEVGTSIGVMSEGWSDYMLTAGSVELIKSEEGLKIGVLATVDGGETLNTYFTVETQYSYMYNNAYNSSITTDLYIDNYTQAYIQDEGDIFLVGKKVWNLTIGQSDVLFKFIGPHDGQGDWLSITLVTPLSATSPVGTYKFVPETFDLELNTALAGERSYINKQGINSWWKSQDGPNSFLSEAPFTAGTVEVKKDDQGNYTVEIMAVDDALPESNSLIVKYNGYILEYNADDTGDFGVANADFYGPYEFPGDNMNWFIGVADYDFKENGFIKGKMWVFDVMASPDKTFSNGLPEGTYRIGANTGFAAGTCHAASYRVYEAYDVKEEVAIVSGTVVVKKMPDGRDMISIDVVDINGTAHKGSYTGVVPTNSVVSIPYDDRYFDGKDARITAVFNGSNYAPTGETPAKQGWDLTLEDATLLDSNGKNGLGISLELRTSLPTSFEEGLPVGIFPLYEPDQTGISHGIYNGGITYYEVRYETASSKVMITGGHIIISKDGNQYNIELALETGNSEVMYRVTGGYTGEITMVDYSTPWSLSPTRSEKKSEAAVTTSMFHK